MNPKAESQPPSPVINAAFEGWRQEGIAFQVLSNQQVSSTAAADSIAVVLRPQQRDQAARILVRVLEGVGHKLLMCADYSALVLCFAHPQTGAQQRFELYIEPPREGAKNCLVSSVMRGIRLRLAPPGLTVVLCGADGCGKSTAGKLLVELLAGTFKPELGRRFHWKPPVFSGRRHAARGPVTEPHDLPPRNRLASLGFFAIHWVEFLLGVPLRLLPVTAQGGLVLIDRYFYDFFVDQRRFQLSVPIVLVRVAYALLPKPDLVFLLDAPTSVLRARKQEVSEAETDRQRAAYAKMASGLPNARIIDATQAADAVARSMQREIFELLAARQKRRGHP